MAEEDLDQQENVEQPEAEFNPAQAQDTESTEIQEPDASIFDVPIDISKEDEKKICDYLENNLPKMRPPENERQMLLSFFSMYDMKARERGFPYEGAPSLASADANERMNAWLDKVETAFIPDNSLSIDREETNLPEEKVNRIEKTFNRKYYKDVLSPELRYIAFEAGYIGASVVCADETYNVRPVREKIVITNEKQLEKSMSSLSSEERTKAKNAINRGEIFAITKDSIKVDNIGPVTRRVDQTKFWFPRNTKKKSEWQLVAEPEFYTKSSMLAMAERKEFDKEAVDDCIQKRLDLRNAIISEQSKPDELPENVKVAMELDSNWQAESKSIKEMGDAYEDEFAVYRCTMLYGLKTEADPNGRLRSWIQVCYCPAGNKLLGKKYLQNGFPYHIIQKRPLPYKAFGNGIAQERYNNNILDTEVKSMFLASIEQEIGSPLLIRNNSTLFASGFRAYPSSISYCDDPQKDAAFMPFPTKSRLAVEAMTIILGGGSPGANKGQGYSSGKREELQIGQEDLSVQSSVRTIAIQLDLLVNDAWKIYCNICKYNTTKNLIVPWVTDDQPTDGTKLYVLSDEMNPNLVWTLIPSAVSMSPDARLQKAIQKFMFFYKNTPVAVNDPTLSIEWLKYMSNYFGMSEDEQKKLLPTLKTFQRYQASLGQQGAAMGGNAPAGGPSAQPPGSPQGGAAVSSSTPPQVPPLVAMSPSNPNHRPPQ